MVGCPKTTSCCQVPPQSQNEYMKLRGEDVFDMVTEVNESVMWSVIDDTTPDVLHRDHLVVVARYVGPDSGEPTKHLFNISDINDKTGDGQAQGIIASVDQKLLDKDGYLIHLCQVYSEGVRQ